MTPEQATLIESAEVYGSELDNSAEVASSHGVPEEAQWFGAMAEAFKDLAAELKRALDENAKLCDRVAKCEPVIELVRALQALNRQAIADGHTEWTEAEYGAMDKIAAAHLPEVTN